MKIEAMSIGIKADGKLYLALLDGVDFNLLAQLIATQCKDGRLSVAEAPDGVSLMTIDQIKEAMNG